MGRWRRVWVGATTQWAHVHKEKQRTQARCQWLHRVRSAVTHRVIVVEAEIFNLHMHLLIKTSGQLRNLGLTISRHKWHQLN